MKNNTILLLSICLTWAACKNDKATGVQDIRDGAGPNADMIHNPLTADLPTDTNQLARILFSETEFDFGELKDGEVVTHKFQFTNTGQVPLMILKAYSGCGCTVPEWPEEPIPPGGQGEISAKFNSAGKSEQQNKIIKIIGNTFPNETQIKIKAFVKPKD